MRLNEPLVSIGIPVYNDAPWLRNALDHVLAQAHNNLEIILADDGSTDGSGEICREYALRDARIRLFENEHNLGLLQNHKFVFDVSAGEYFAWGSGHDYLHPEFVSRLLENLRTNPSVVMSCPRSVFINENEEIFRTTKGGLDTRGLPPAVRFEKLLTHLVGGGTANLFYGLYRQEALAQMNLSRKVDGHDVIMLGELSLLGEMTQVDEVLYYRLVTIAESGKQRAARHTEMLAGARGFNVAVLMPYFAASSEFLSIAENDRLSAVERQHVYDNVVKFDVNLAKAAIADEIQHFISYSREELASLDSHQQVRRFRAAQILGMLEQARLLGFDFEGLHELRSTCLSMIGLQAEATAAARHVAKFYRIKKMQRIFSHYRLKVTAFLYKLIGDKAWRTL